MTTAYQNPGPSRAEIDAWGGATLIEFGTPWCGFCRAAQPAIAQALGAHPGLRHFRVEDARGRPLGRSFGVKLWPTLVLVVDGREVARLVRPVDTASIAQALNRLSDPPARQETPGPQPPL